MKYKIAPVLCFILLVARCYSQDFKRHIVFLASDSLHGRAPVTTDEKNAAAYIARELRSGGCNNIVFQKFPFENDSAINVLGSINKGKDSTIIISAHYDHLGWGSNKSLEIIHKKGIYPGADDNASGVAMMIELAHWVAQQKGLKYNYIFAAYSGHEAGLYGSDYFSKSNLRSTLKIRAVLNFDMVGRLDIGSNTLQVSGIYTDSLFGRYFNRQQDQAMHFIFDDYPLANTDLKPFSSDGTPVLNLFTGIHDDYHRTTDTEDKINYRGMKSIYILVTRLLAEFN